MKIRIKDEGRGFTLRLPSTMILSRPVAGLIAKLIVKHVADEEDAATENEVRERIGRLKCELTPLLHGLRRFKRSHRGFKLLEVEDSDGSAVEVWL